MPDTKTTARMRNYRARLRSEGLRPVQIWVPDENAPGFREEVRTQITSLDPHEESDTMDFLEKLEDWPEDA